MLCEKCNKNAAQFHYKSVVNGVMKEFNVCPQCAHEMGIGTMFNIPQFSLGIDSLLANMLGMPTSSPKEGAETCPLCGSTAGDVSRGGRPGCAQCYDVFNSMLDPYVKRIHGNTSHIGRVPESASAEVRSRREIKALKDELKAAVESQEYELAAEIRDKLKKLEGPHNE